MQVVCRVSVKNIKKLGSGPRNKEHPETGWPGLADPQQEEGEPIDFHQEGNPDEEGHWVGSIEIEGEPPKKYEIIDIV